MNDQDLHVVNSHKHLGVIISDNGQWNDHIDDIVKKAYYRLNKMRKSRTFLLNSWTHFCFLSIAIKLNYFFFLPSQNSIFFSMLYIKV